MLSDAQWAVLEPLVEACRPPAKVPPSDLRRTVEAIIWRCTNGAKWRSVPAELGPWWKAAQIFIRWSRLGAWDRLLDMAEARGVELGMAFLDGTSIRAHAKAAGASKKGDLAEATEKVRRLGALVVALAPRPWLLRTPVVGPLPSGSRRGKRTSCPTPCPCWTDCPACRAGWWRIGATPATPSASTFGAGARGPRSRPSATRPRWPVRPGPTPIAIGSSACGGG